MTEQRATERQRAAAVAAGKQAADMVLRGGRVVDVHTGRIYRADVATAGRRIAAVGNVDHCVEPATATLDCSGLFLVPGFIDTHIHVGGSQLTIQRLAEAMVPCGTAAICTDFYELGTLAGLDPVLREVEASRGTGLDILLSPFFAAVLGLGQFGNLERFTFEDLDQLLAHDACIELREWNCWASWLPLEGMGQTYETALRFGRTIGGHLEGLSGPNLQASVALGTRSEHEAVTTAEALERIKAGVIVEIREGSGARDFHDLLPAITEHGADPAMFSFCTDEQQLEWIIRDGHIDRIVRLAVAEGVAPVEAIRMGTRNAALALGVSDDYGSITPGRIASIVAVDDLATLPIRLVVSGGQLSVDNGTYLLHPPAASYPEAARTTVNVEERLTSDDFLLAADGEAEVRVIGVTPGKLVTEERTEGVRLVGGRLADTEYGLAKIAVIDRHEGGKLRSVGLIRGLALQRGAFAATFNPGMCNLMVVGIDEEDMAVAANRVVELQGGMVVAAGGEAVAEVALPLYGFMTDAPLDEVADACTAVAEAIQSELQSPVSGFLTTVGFTCLAVSIPSLKICDRGLVRVRRDGQEAVEFLVG